MNEDTRSTGQLAHRSILDLDHNEVRDFLLKPDSYCSLELPPYIVFRDLIHDVDQVLVGKPLSDLTQSKPRDLDNVNYTILNNKDGKYSWRPFELIHPALYVSLVHTVGSKDNWGLIGNRFNEFANNDRLKCLSIPVESTSNQKDDAAQILHWWHEIEQYSIELSLDYEYLFETDIVDCYGAIYTHSIAWALHGIPEAKKNRKDRKLIGNNIDNHIQDMRRGQTNGIPQGSALMDLVAELVLGLADLELSERLEKEGIEEYKILRYRDDYRIFVNSPQVGEAIVKQLSETTTALGLKLSASKTKESSDVIRASIKDDKLAWMIRKQGDARLQKHLLIIHDHSTLFPNSGSIATALSDYLKRISKFKYLREDPKPLIAIVVDIAFRSPRTYAVCAAILSKLLSFVETEDERLDIVRRIRRKFARIPNTGHMQIWLQRITIPLQRSYEYEEAVCKLVAGSSSSLWNNGWLSSRELIAALDATKLVDQEMLEEIAPVIPPEEVELFTSRANSPFYR